MAYPATPAHVLKWAFKRQFHLSEIPSCGSGFPCVECGVLARKQCHTDSPLLPSLNNGPLNDQVPEIQMPTNQAYGTKKENPEPCKQTQPCAFRLVEDMLRQMEGRVFQ